MHQKAVLAVLLAAGLLCLALAPVCRAEDVPEDDQVDDLDVEDELDLLGGVEEEDEELDGDVQDEAPPSPKTPAAPKVKQKLIGRFFFLNQ